MCTLSYHIHKKLYIYFRLFLRKYLIQLYTVRELLLIIVDAAKVRTFCEEKTECGFEKLISLKEL